MIILDQFFFVKYVFSGYDVGYDFFQGHFGHFAGGFTFLIAALYWMIRVSKFNRDIFKLIAAYFPSPLAISGAAGRSEK